MSQVEAFKGRLVPVDLAGKSFPEWVQELTGLEDPGPYGSWEEELNEWAWAQNRAGNKVPEYYFNSELQELFVVEKRKLSPEDFVVGERQPDGSYTFVVSYYNGGAGFNEILDEVIDG